MKKLFIIIAICGFAFGTTTSCKKARTCECDGYSLPLPKGKKGDQKDACSALEAYGQYKDCSLK